MSTFDFVSTDKAPGAIGPYSQAVAVDGWMFCSGQIPMDPSTGELVGGDIGAQTDQVMKNLTAVVKAGGGSLSNIVETGLAGSKGARVIHQHVEATSVATPDESMYGTPPRSTTSRLGPPWPSGRFRRM